MQQHIQVKLNKHTIKTDFEAFYQSLLNNISHISENDISLIKTKLGSTYEKYSNVYVPYKNRRFVENLAKNNSIVIMKQDKGRSIVIMDQHNYTKKCLEMLNTKQFSKLVLIRLKRQRQRSKEFCEKSKPKLPSRNTIIYILQVLVPKTFMVPLR